MPLKRIEPHQQHKCLGYFGYYYGIVRARGESRSTGCCTCSLVDFCKQATRSNGAKAFPSVFNDFNNWAAKDGYFAALREMWTQHGCFDPIDSVHIKNEEDGLQVRKPGYSLRVDSDLRLPMIGMEEVLNGDSSQDW